MITHIVDGKTYVPIDQLQLNPYNPRSILKDNYDRLKRHLIKYGQYKPLIVNQDGVVVGGNMRLRVMQDLGWEKVWISVVEAHTKAKMLEYTLSDNESFGNWEEEALAEMLLDTQGDLILEDFRIDRGSSELKDLLDKFAPSDEEEEKEEDDYERNEESDAIICPKCGHQWEE